VDASNVILVGGVEDAALAQAGGQAREYALRALRLAGEAFVGMTSVRELVEWIGGQIGGRVRHGGAGRARAAVETPLPTLPDPPRSAHTHGEYAKVRLFDIGGTEAVGTVADIAALSGLTEQAVFNQVQQGQAINGLAFVLHPSHRPHKGKAIIRISPDQTRCHFPSAEAAGVASDLPASGILRAARKGRTCGGYNWALAVGGDDGDEVEGAAVDGDDGDQAAGGAVGNGTGCDGSAVDGGGGDGAATAIGGI
jgi:hypothetical protein